MIWAFDTSINNGLPNLNTVDISRCTGLERVGIISDQLTSLDVSNHSNLQWLVCEGKGLKSVTLGNQPNLTELYCTESPIASLDISGCPKLLAIINDKYKKVHKKGEADYSYDCIAWKKGSVQIQISPTTKLVTEHKSETVTPSADNTITTTATSTKTSAEVGQSYTISAPGFKASGFKSSNKKVATVTKAGKIVPKKAGKVKITYKVNGKTRTVTLTVKDPTVPTKVSLNMTGTNAAKAGDKITLTATLNEGGVSGIKWTTSDKKIATVKNGVVTFKKAGKVTITATTKRGNKKAKVKFTVSK